MQQLKWKNCWSVWLNYVPQRDDLDAEMVPKRLQTVQNVREMLDILEFFAVLFENLATYAFYIGGNLMLQHVWCR